MAKERRVIKGIVLRSVDTKEADKILTVLTGEMGKITVVAKGARSRRSRVTAAAQLLSYAEMTLTESHGWQILTEASTIALFDGVREDVVLLSLASYFAELTEAVTCEGIPAEDFLSHLLNALYALSVLRRPQLLVKAAFELRLMALSGFEPLIEGCSVCGRVEPERPMLNLVEGTLRCAACRQGERLAMPLAPGALDAMRYILYGDPKRLYSFSLPQEELRSMAEATEAYVAAQLERSFHTLGFYKSLHDALQ